MKTDSLENGNLSSLKNNDNKNFELSYDESGIISLKDNINNVNYIFKYNDNLDVIGIDGDNGFSINYEFNDSSSTTTYNDNGIIRTSIQTNSTINEDTNEYSTSSETKLLSGDKLNTIINTKEENYSAVTTISRNDGSIILSKNIVKNNTSSWRCKE